MKKVIRILFMLFVFAVLCLGVYWGYQTFFVKKTHVVFSTQKVERKDMRSTISATGTVEPEELVNVGAQVGGMISTFGIDADGKTVNYGSNVKAGMVLANIDDALYVAELRRAEAEKKQAEASIASAEALIRQSESKYELAKSNWTRAQTLYPQNIMSKSDYDGYQSEFFTAEAAIAVSKASLLTAKASLAAAEAALEKASKNLGYCVIKSPVDGVIIDRRVNIGQTVVSSMSAPSLFLIAKDLRKMQVWVSVNEADIGQIKPGLPVTFTVDSFPGRIFDGLVQKIRLNATMSQNVVTYVVEIGTDNSSGTLLPYLTANVDFVLDRRENVLTVPNSAFRFQPDSGMVPEKYLSYSLSDAERRIWVLEENGSIRPVSVRTGLNDGVQTEISSKELIPGTPVVTGAKTVTGSKQVKTADSAPAKSPFLPTPPKHSGSQKK